MTLEELRAIENWDDYCYEQCLLILRDDEDLVDMTGRQLMMDSENPREDGVFDLIGVLLFQAGWLDYFHKLDPAVQKRLEIAIKELPVD